MGGYSPDGASIVYRVDRGDEAAFVMAADGSDVRQVTEFSDFRPRFIDWGPHRPEPPPFMADWPVGPERPTPPASSPDDHRARDLTRPTDELRPSLSPGRAGLVRISMSAAAGGPAAVVGCHVGVTSCARVMSREQS